MKKLLALMLSLLMVCGLAACGEEQSKLTPYEIVKQASEKLDNADGVAYDMIMAMKMSDSTDAENSLQMNFSGDVKMQKIAENDYNIGYNMTTDLSAIDAAAGSIDMSMFYTDGYMYYDMSDLGVKYKIAMDMQDAMETVNSSSFSEIEQDMVKEQSIAADGDGQVVSLLLDGTKMTDMVMSMADEITGVLGDGNNITLGDIPYTVYLDDAGNITNVEMNMSMSITADGVTMDMTIDLTMNVVEVGGVVVDLPADLADYPEMSLSATDLDTAA